ncbi:DUF892 family protein [Streptomyces sp. NPDC047049]|uniref:DUF892 family protein n=1 Tax=Streptomyces sp. NPDC047049 TaxID=3156688 RepID=UPI0033C5BECF
MSGRTAGGQYLRHLKETRLVERLIATALGSLTASARAPGLRKPLEKHREATRRRIAALGSRLHAHHEQPSFVKDMTLRPAGVMAALPVDPRRTYAKVR